MAFVKALGFSFFLRKLTLNKRGIFKLIRAPNVIIKFASPIIFLMIQSKKICDTKIIKELRPIKAKNIVANLYLSVTADKLNIITIPEHANNKATNG